MVAPKPRYVIVNTTRCRCTSKRNPLKWRRYATTCSHSLGRTRRRREIISGARDRPVHHQRCIFAICPPGVDICPGCEKPCPQMPETRSPVVCQYDEMHNAPRSQIQKPKVNRPSAIKKNCKPSSSHSGRCPKSLPSKSLRQNAYCAPNP